MQPRAAHNKMTLLQRLMDAVGRRRRHQVLVLVATTRGRRVVPMDLRP